MADDAKRSEDQGTAGQRADPVAAGNADLAQAGGPVAGEPGAGGAATGSGGHHGKGAAAPSGRRADASGPPAAGDVAPLVHTAMDDDVRDTEEKARRTASP